MRFSEVLFMSCYWLVWVVFAFFVWYFAVRRVKNLLLRSLLFSLLFAPSIVVSHQGAFIVPAFLFIPIVKTWGYWAFPIFSLWAIFWIFVSLSNLIDRILDSDAS